MFLFQLRVQVHDGGSPVRSNETVVRVEVDRNFHHATFSSSRYEAVVEESVQFGHELVTVSAKDDDREVP